MSHWLYNIIRFGRQALPRPVVQFTSEVIRQQEDPFLKRRVCGSSVAGGVKQTAGVALCLCVSAIAAILAEPTATRADTVYVSNWSSDTIMRFTADGIGSVFYSGGSES